MTWAEVLAVFNFIAWLLPLILRAWMAFKYDNNNRVVLSTEESGKISRAIANLKLRGKKLSISNGTKTDSGIQK